MKLSPIQMIILLVVLAGFVIGTYFATVDQLPNLSGKVIGNTTSTPNATNQTIATFYIADESNNTSNTLILVKNSTKIYKETKDNNEVETNITAINNGCKIDVYTVGDSSNTIPPQITAEKIVVKKEKK